ncbi:uncharacterized protein CC84DRAFT_1224026 [Paraphaeosphaeria sporulosa]|uniref:Uncharacterized protein n=1 Tax=Paraphaeosphaeria sporulosa TaxID=1460663 RepID=A0A177CVG7_9PLEO|nr:uncharacterized protein CC84DRAFT_1224026 [Paraphaeosphaeria sporulosa]OAG11236.1 hypothetical protein CC84DRAFT_1224026 [Paraphaeosphaeria sporulosa]
MLACISVTPDIMSYRKPEADGQRNDCQSEADHGSDGDARLSPYWFDCSYRDFVGTASGLAWAHQSSFTARMPGSCSRLPVWTLLPETCLDSRNSSTLYLFQKTRQICATGKPGCKRAPTDYTYADVAEWLICCRAMIWSTNPNLPRAASAAVGSHINETTLTSLCMPRKYIAFLQLESQQITGSITLTRHAKGPGATRAP